MEESEEDVVIKQKNIFTVLLNGKDQLLVEDELMDLEELRESAIEFLDNGGGVGEDACNYCKGKKDPKSSDNPDKAIISLKNERETSYATFNIGGYTNVIYYFPSKLCRIVVFSGYIRMYVINVSNYLWNCFKRNW